MNTETVSLAVSAAITMQQQNSARSIQSNEGRLGPSDIGFCRNKAALKIKGVQPTDHKPMWAAFCGTAIGHDVEVALKAAYPTWIVGAVDHLTVTATLPSGHQVSGSPDIVVPEWNAVLDLKTVDGFTWVKRNGTSLNHKYQRHLYALGAAQQGILNPDKPIYVGNVYLDRSGTIPTPHVTFEELDPSLTREVDDWYTDVMYAKEHNEQASQDIAPETCEKICEFFTACRGGYLPDSHEPEVIRDPEIVDAANAYDEARRMEKEAKRIKEAATKVLVGHNGRVGEDWQLRWTEVGASDIPGYVRQPYTKISLTKARRGA